MTSNIQQFVPFKRLGTVISPKVAGDSIYMPTGRASTFIVAANDTSTLAKNQADYVCDATADDVQIQAAIDALPATGGKILLLEGTYNVAASIVLDSYTTLEGCGIGTIINKGAITDYIIEGASAATNINASNMCLDGNKGTNSDIHALLFLYHQRNSIVDNIYFKNTTDLGYNIVSHYSEGCIIQNCYTTDGSYGIYLLGDVTTREGMHNITIGNVLTGFRNVAIALCYSDYTIVDNNITYDAGASDTIGVDCYGNTYPSYHCMIKNNMVYNLPGTSVGIRANYSEYTIVDSNVIYDAYYGINADTGANYIAITNNSINDCSYRGIGVLAANGANISNNHTNASGWNGNIRLSALLHSVVSNNVCMNCDGGAGIYTEGANESLLITGNICADDQSPKTQTYGLEIANSTTGLLVNNNIFKNNLTANILLGTGTSDISLDTPSSDTAITAAGGITITNKIMRIIGNGGAIDITANPQIAEGSYDGQLVILQGTHDTSTVKLDDGNGIILSSGVSFTLGANDTIELVYDSGESAWIEIHRSDN